MKSYNGYIEEFGDYEVAGMLYDLAAGYRELDATILDRYFMARMHDAFTDVEYARLANTVDAAMIDTEWNGVL